MPTLKPLTSEPLVFFFSGGDILWRGDGRPQVITEQAPALRELYGEEADAAWCAGDRSTAKHAAKLWLQLTKAYHAREEWIRAASYGRAA